MVTAAQAWQDVARIREASPLVHNITNHVVMNTTANALLALGASPVMAHAPEEVEDIVALSGALVLNIGTLDAPWVEAMLKAGACAKARGVPVVLDPVGAGASTYRTTTALALAAGSGPAVIRGNASEVMALAGSVATTRGVDSVHATSEAEAAAQGLTRAYGCAVSVSGPVDIIVSAGATTRVGNGHPLMPRITGLGCTASAVTGAFVAINPDAHAAAAHAMVVMGVAGEIAAARCGGPGTFWPQFLDALHGLTEADLETRLRVRDA